MDNAQQLSLSTLMLTLTKRPEQDAAMFGKHFASMYTGSLFGKPAVVFAVWGYVIAFMRPDRKDGVCFVELNPTLLAATFACTVEEIHAALDELEAPDERSRGKDEDGRRLILLSEARHSGPLQYRVVNGSKYRSLRDEEERRVYLREAKRKERAVARVNNVNQSQPPSSQVEVEEEVEAEGEAGSQSLSASRRSSKKKSTAKELVESFQLEPKHREWGAKNAPSVPLDTELEAWKDRERTNGYTTGKAPGKPVENAQAAFYTACRNAENWGTYGKGAPAKRIKGGLIDKHFGNR